MAELVVLSAPANSTPPLRLGDRLEAGPELSFGQATMATFHLDGPAAFQLSVRPQAGGWSLVIAGQPPRIRLNGVLVDDRRGVPLTHGDVLHLESGLVLRFELTPMRSARSLHLEHAVANAPDDAGTWAVYRDFLLEQGDPLGEWALRAAGASPEDQRRMLGPLAALTTRDSARFRWNAHGFLDLVVLREAALNARLPWFLGQLRRLPVARFLRRLWVDVYVDGPKTTPLDRDGQLAPVFSAVLGAEWLWSLEELFLGHRVPGPLPPGLAEGMFAMREAAPRLRTTVSDVTATALAPSEWLGLGRELRGLPASGANVAQGGEWGFDVLAAPRDVELPGRQSLGFRDSPLFIGSGASAWVRLYDRRVPALQCAVVANEDSSWWLVVPKGQRGVSVDGTPQTAVPLHEGDVVEPAPGLKLRVDRA